MTERYDLLVIGGGSAGSTAASIAVKRGLSVAQAERWKVGGTCLNAGCDPTKTMIATAKVLHQARSAAQYGLRIPEAHADWPAIRSRVDRVINEIRGGDGDANVRETGVALFKGDARFLDPHTVHIDGEHPTTIQADRVILATGADEIRPDIPGLAAAGYLTNRELMQLDVLPKTLAIIGGGTIATEFAQMFARLGVRVTLFGSDPHILPREEPRLSQALQSVLERDGVTICTDARITAVKEDQGLHCLYGARPDDPEQHVELCRVQRIVVAVGRKPVTDLNLEAAGVAFDADTGVQVDETLRTTAGHIWAAGDCTGQFPFTHFASYQGEIAGYNAIGETPSRVADNRTIPWTTFTDPELARVGMTAAEAREAGHTVQETTVQIADFPRPKTTDERDGMVKLVVDRSNGKLLGAHILAPMAGELLAELVLTMRLGLPISVVAETIHSYPTYGDAVYWAARSAVEAMGDAEAGDEPPR